MARQARASRKQATQRPEKAEKFKRQFPSLQAKNTNQKALFHYMLRGDQIVVAQGSAGTGKTYLAMWKAAKDFEERKTDKIILIRAYQPLAGRTIGMLPGTQEEKLYPFYKQMLDYLEDFLGKGAVEIALKQGQIEICSLETIRGRSWENATVVVDEGQNLFVPEVQALTTRLGEGSQMIICGDNSGIQTDVRNGMDGLAYLNAIVEKYDIPGVSFVDFTRDDIVRSGLTKDFVIAYEEEQDAEARGEKVIIPIAEQNGQFKKGR